MKLVELAQKWKNKELTEEQLAKEVPNVKIFKMPHLENETDDKLFISINGDSWDEVLEEVFAMSEDEFFKFQELFKKYKN